MGILSLLTGALTLRTATFAQLRERSDVLLRGFLVVLAVGILSGVFQAGADVLSRTGGGASADQVARDALGTIQQINAVPLPFQPIVRDSIREGAAIGIDIRKLPPQTGAAFAPVARFVEWIGQTLSTPLGLGFLGYWLLAGLLVHLTSRWLGGRASMAQLLGLAALALAPHVLDPLATILNSAAVATGADALGALGWLIGLITWLWGLVILVKATSVAEGLDIGRAIGAVILALVVAAVVAMVAAFVIGAVVAQVAVTFLSALK